jgi:hypothetical protein
MCKGVFELTKKKISKKLTSIKRQALYLGPYLLTLALALNKRLHASKWPPSTEQCKGHFPLRAHTMRNAGAEMQAGVEGEHSH